MGLVLERLFCSGRATRAEVGQPGHRGRRGSLCSGAQQRQELADLRTGYRCFRGNGRVDTPHADSAGHLSAEPATSWRSVSWVGKTAFPYADLRSAAVKIEIVFLRYVIVERDWGVHWI